MSDCAPPDVRIVERGAVPDLLPQLASLRIAVFREWPYLYDGDAAYEEEYLAPYATEEKATLVGAFDGDRLVGAATAMPLLAHSDDFSAAFAGTGLDLTRLWYCAESVLLPGWRGRGIGHRFFDLREARGKALGFSASCFCGVIRPENHPDRPGDARSLVPFWSARGYAPVQGAVARFSWKDIGDGGPSEKQLQFWMRDL